MRSKQQYSSYSATEGKVLYEKVLFPQIYAICDTEFSLLPPEYTQVFVAYQFEWRLNVICRTADFHSGSSMMLMHLSKSTIIQLSRRTLAATCSGNSVITFTAESVYKSVIDEIMNMFRPQEGSNPHTTWNQTMHHNLPTADKKFLNDELAYKQTNHWNSS